VRQEGGYRLGACRSLKGDRSSNCRAMKPVEGAGMEAAQWRWGAGSWGDWGQGACIGLGGD
jgi:hypothetical protein